MSFKIFHGSIRKKLIILVLLATLPTFILYFYTEISNREDKVLRAKNTISRLVNGFSLIQQRVTESTHTLLKTVAAMPAVRKLNEAKAHVILSTLLKANPIYTNAILVDLNGDVVSAGKGGEEAKRLNFADRKQFKEACSTGEFSAGEFVIGKQSQKSIFPFAMPVMGDDGKPVGVVLIGVRLSYYCKLFRDADLYSRAFFGVSDFKGIRIFRYPMSEDVTVGLPIKSEVFRRAEHKGNPGVFETKDSSDVNRIIAYTPLRISSESPPYMYMFIGVDSSEVMEKANLVLLRGIFITLVALSLSLLIAWFVGGSAVAESIEKLAAATRRLGQGDDTLVSGVDYSDGEVGYLAQTLDGMSSLIHKREVERNEALKQLSESEEQHRILFENNPVGICLVNPETNIIEFANPAFMSLLELEDKQLGSLSLFELKYSLDAKIDAGDFKKNILGNGWNAYSVPCVTRSGQMIVVDIVSANIKIKGKDFLAGFFTDITARKHSENKLLEAKEVAEQANAAKNDFLANISHEVRTPLNGVLGMLQLLQTTNLNKEQNEYVDIGLRSSQSLMRVLEDLLDFSKIEAGKLDIYEKPFEVSELLKQCIDLLKVQADEKGIELSGQISTETQDIYLGDVGRLRQILFNLIGNAIKFTDSGSINIDIYSLPHRDTSKERLFFVVKDTGVGIPDDKIADIFESFTQVDGSRTRKYQGVGLGLSIVKRLVLLMNGSMNIESEPGIGTTVLICVQVGRNVSQVVVEFEEGESSAKPRNLNLLLVEDERVNRIMAKKILEKMGHRVTCAENGQQCLNMITKDSYDAVLMDIQMPVLTGIEASRIIRTSPEYADVSSTPIVALTAHATKSDMDAAFDVGMNEYITKPFDKSVLEDVLQRMIGLHA
ncbi:ATP-binding protein [Maridesulfovibrio zosterae]|uniref:ATP-binding protein n=1 Tax=Maridesulfovibrio zosterae TaxID=82171 RepID=UPI000405E3B1|nr:ATP-binding protein [Maridesulfovibrio zosterae]